jgi:hypothetical protein
LAHILHTKHRKVAEIKALIEKTERLAAKFEKMRTGRGPRPKHHPMVERNHKWVLLDTESQPPRLIQGSERAAEKLIAAQADFMVVESPFNPASWPASREKPTDTQKKMLVWLDEFDKLMQRCQDHFVFWERKDILALFPLANPRSGTFYPNAQGIAAGLGRQVELLVRELDDPRESLLLRVGRDLSCVLKEARQAFPCDKQATAADSIGVSVDALKRWESGERKKLRANSRARVETYVLKKLLPS